MAGSVPGKFQGLQCATHPAPAKQRWGKGEGGRATTQMDPEPGLCSPILPSLQDPEIRQALGMGETEETPAEGEIERQSDGKGDTGEKQIEGGEAAQRRETAWNRDRGDAERRWEAETVSPRQTRSETQRADRGQSQGRETELRETQEKKVLRGERFTG